MNRQQIELRVGELASRVGYPMPTVNWVPGKAGQHAVLLQDDGRTLVLHERLDEEYGEQERDLLIAQELVQARLGGPRQRKWIKTAESIASSLVVGAAVLLVRSMEAPLWKGFLLAVGGACLVWTVCRVVLGAIWTRWFTRRSDQALAEIVGRDQVCEWLKKTVNAEPPLSFPSRLRWWSRGAPPSAAERLRVLGAR